VKRSAFAFTGLAGAGSTTAAGVTAAALGIDEDVGRLHICYTSIFELVV